MKVKFVKDCEIEVVQSFDEDTEKTKSYFEILKVDEELEFDIVDFAKMPDGKTDDRNALNVQFPDGSVAFGLMTDWFEIIEARDLDEQKLISEQIDNGFVCLEYVPGTANSPWFWRIGKTVDTCSEAESWWTKQRLIARVYHVFMGKAQLRFAK